MAIDVVEHIEDYFGFLRNLKNKGEYKLFHIPLEMSVKSVLKMYPIETREKFGHIHYFAKDTVLAALKDTGYEIVDYFYTSIVIHKAPKSLKSFLLKLGHAIHKDLSVRILGAYSLMVLAK
jgi:hypothetical protein